MKVILTKETDFDNEQIEENVWYWVKTYPDCNMDKCFRRLSQAEDYYTKLSKAVSEGKSFAKVKEIINETQVEPNEQPTDSLS